MMMMMMMVSVLAVVAQNAAQPVKAKIHYISFTVASPRKVRNINDKSITSPYNNVCSFPVYGFSVITAVAPPNPSHAGWYSIYLPRRDGRLS